MHRARAIVMLSCLLCSSACTGGGSADAAASDAAQRDTQESGASAEQDAARAEEDAGAGPVAGDVDASSMEAGLGADASLREGGVVDATSASDATMTVPRDAGSGPDAGPRAESFFIVVGGGTKIVRSEDGSSWTVVNDSYPGAAGWDGFDTENLFRAACAGRLASGEPLVLAVGGGTAASNEGRAVSNVPGRIARSRDGRSWTHTQRIDGAAAGPLLATNWLGGCAFGNGLVVVTGAYFSLTSSDGASWTKHAISGLQAGGAGVDFFARNMAFGAGVFVAAGEPGIYASADGERWEVVSRTRANRVFFYGGVFIAPFENTTQYQRSTDGRRWTSHTAPAGINRVAHDGQRFIASSHDGALLTSDDGLQFSQRPNQNAQSLMGIAFGKGAYVSVRDMGSALTFRGAVTTGTLAWQRVEIPGDAEGFHDLSLLFAAFD